MFRNIAAWIWDACRPRWPPSRFDWIVFLGTVVLCLFSWWLTSVTSRPYY